MENLEFYIFENELWCLYPDGKNKEVTEKDTDLIKFMIDRIKELYPKAYLDLEKWFKNSSLNVPYFQFLIVRQFGKCNFGNLDNTTKDVDVRGCFNFEKVPCPLRGICQHEGVVCRPEFNSKISNAEMRVMKLIYEGMSNNEIAEKLYLSPFTIKNHVKSVYLKLGIHNRTEFMKYALENNLFN